jgi:hypothetical protein
VPRMMRRPLRLVLLGLLLAGLISRALEQAGAYECGCYPECWCMRPGLSLRRSASARLFLPASG